MPKFEPDFENTSVSTLILGKGLVEVAFGKPFGFANYKKDEDGNTTEDVSAGVRIPLKVVGRVRSDGSVDTEVDYAGEQISMASFWLHNQGSVKSTKRALMGIFGFSQKEEDEFNAWYKSQDFSVDTGDEDEDGKFSNVTIGEGWKQLDGMHAIVNLDKSINKRTDEEQQDFKSWKPAVQKASV